MKIRIFNEQGIEKFREYIGEVRGGSEDPIPDSLITSDEYSAENTKKVEIEKREFLTKSETVKYLHEQILQLDEQNKFYNDGLWAWISAFYFDIVCPIRTDGTRKPGADARHILEPRNWKTYYRHLLASPFRLYHELGEDLSKIYLAGTPDKHGDMFEQMASAQEVATPSGVVEAATLLYWDESAGGFKGGSTNRNKSGNVRRFARAIMPQFQMTYDLNSMNGAEILELLPAEFDNWKP